MSRGRRGCTLWDCVASPTSPPSARVLLALAAAFLLMGSPLRASAQPAPPGAAEPSPAEALFQEARRLMSEGRHAEACPKLEESLRLDPAPGTQFNLAECWVATGRPGRAWHLYMEVAAAAKAAGFPDKEKIARDRAVGLEPRVGRLAIEVPPGVTATVERDGAPLPPSAFGRLEVVEPGTHRIAATAPGRTPFSKTVEVPAGTVHTVRVELVDPNRRERPAPPPPPPPPAPGGLGPQEVAGVAVGAAGIGGVVVGAILGFRAMSMHDEAQEDHCPEPTRCDAIGVDLTSSAQEAGTGSTIAFAIGGAAVVAGVILFATAPTPESSVRVGATARGLRLEARW